MRMKFFKNILVYIFVFSVILQVHLFFPFNKLTEKIYAQEAIPVSLSVKQLTLMLTDAKVVSGTESAKEKVFTDRENISVNAYQNPVADVTNWILSRKKISLLTVFILGGIGLFIYYRIKKRIK